jgi:spermidine synthase
LGLFFLSGISGLLYEVAWTRMLHLLFGDTVLAVSTVLVSFMAGLALGSFWSGRYADRCHRVLGLYAALEAALGLTALLVPLALQALTPLYVWVHQHLYPAMFLLSLARFLLAFCILMLPTTLMGATLPVLSRYMVQSTARLGWHVGVLYGLNTGGAVLGCFAAGYLLIGHVGLYQTVGLGAVLNLVIACVVWAVRQRVEVRLPSTVEPDDDGSMAQPEAAPGYEAGTVRLVLASVALSGMAALAYEVIWTRALTFFIGNSTYAFSAMLTTFLAGLAVGSLLLARFSDRQPHLVTLLGGLHVAIGVYGLLTVPILGSVFYGLDTWWQGFSRAYWDTPVWLTFAKTFMVIFPPTLGLGGLFPVASKIVARGPQTIARSIGNIYALNTLGAIAGAWLSGFVALPVLGTRISLMLTACLSVAIGGVLVARQSASHPLLRLGVLAAVAGVFIAVLVSTPTLRFADIAGEPEKKLLYYDEGIAGIVKVSTDIYDRKLLSVNGWSVAGTGTPSADVALVNDYPEIQKLLAHLPMLLHPAPQHALIVGFGAGGTAWSMSRYQNLKHLDVVEFVPGVIRAAHLFPEVNHNVLADPRLRVILDDGRHYLLVTSQTYDVISVDTLDPKHAGNGNLYTREFYELSKQALRPGGIFVQWLPYHQVDNASLKLIARTFQHVYPHATLWLNRFKGYTILLGTREPLQIDVARLEERFHHTEIQQDLAEVHVATPWQFLEGFAMRAATLQRYTAGDTRLNSYNHPYVEFYGTSWHDPVEENLAELAWFADDVTPLLVFPPELAQGYQQDVLTRLAQQRRLSHYIFQGYLANWRRQLQAGTRSYRKALALDPHDDGVKFALGVSARHKEHALAVLAQQPNDTKTLSKLGYIAWNEQQYDDAIRYFQQVLKIDANNAAAYVHLGVNYLAQERFEASIAAYRTAARLNPEFAELAAQSIDLIQHQQRAAAQPDDVEVHWQLGRIYSDDGRSDRAITAFERVTALAPNVPQGFLQLARSYEAEGRDSEAIRAYSRVLELEPEHVQARNNVEKLAIKMALERGVQATVRLDAEHVLQVDPDSASSYYHLGLRYLRNDEPEAAAMALHQAVQLQPGHDTAYLFLGVAYATAGMSAKAEGAYRHVIALSPDKAEAYYYLGSLYQQQQQYRQAIQAYRQAIARAPEPAMPYANLGTVYEALGEREQALTAYRQALQRDTNLGFVQERINALSQ